MTTKRGRTPGVRTELPAAVLLPAAEEAVVCGLGTVVKSNPFFSWNSTLRVTTTSSVSGK